MQVWLRGQLPYLLELRRLLGFIIQVAQKWHQLINQTLMELELLILKTPLVQMYVGEPVWLVQIQQDLPSPRLTSGLLAVSYTHLTLPTKA